MGISINGPSGIDTASLIDQLVALEQEKVTKVQTRKTTYQVQFDAYSKLKSMLADVAAKAMNVNALTSFDVFKSASSDESLVTAKGGVGAMEGSYDLNVYHLAKNEKMISKDGKVTSQSAALSTFGITTGVISVNGTSITVSDTDTIQDLRRKINSATDSLGNKLGVTASVLKISDTNYRLVLSSKATGAKGIEYKDVSGSTLQDLGIITTAAGAKGNTSQTIATQNNFQTVFDGLAAGTAIVYSGVDHDGNAVTNTFVKTAATTTVDEFLAQVKASFHNMVSATIDGATGQLVIGDGIEGTSQLALNSLSAGGSAVATSVTVSGKEGTGVLSTGSDAYFNLDGLFMNSASNSPEGVITGVTLQFHSVSVSKTATVSLDRDTDGIKKKVQDLLDSYNALLKWANDETKMPDSKAASGSDAAKGGDLAGDMTVSSLIGQVRNTLQSQFNLFGGSLTSLTMIGVKTDSKTGEMSIDDTMFQKAVTTGFDEFTRMFVTTGISDNKNVVLGRSTNMTKSGAYTLRETDAFHFDIQIAGDATWYTSDARNGDIVTFSSGPAAGLSLTAAAGSLGGVDTAFNFSRGLGDRINDIIGTINAAGTGSIVTHQDSITSMMKSADGRIDMLQRSVDAYHARLVKQFSAMEQALSTMKSQSNNMLAALGYSTSK
jgi:flagellar capping protein FliD